MTPTDTLEPKALEEERQTLIETAEGLEMSATAEQFVFDGLQPMVDRFHAGDHSPEVMRSLRVYNDARHNRDWWRKQAAAIRAYLSAASIPQPAGSNERVNHAINELADCVCNVIQLLKNVRAGITDPDVAVKRAEDNYEYAIGVAHAAQAAQPVEGETK